MLLKAQFGQYTQSNIRLIERGWMRARFITNGVLALVGLFGVIIAIVRDYGDNSALLMAGFVFAGIAAFANFVMGVLTLSLIGGAKNKGLGIASGVLAIFGGVLGVNAIVSFIGAHKEKKSNSSD